MKKIAVTVFSFGELSKEAQKSVLNEMRHTNVENDWYKGIVENWTEKLKSLGYENIEVLFSGFGSQGDGACFTASVDIKKWLKAHKLTKKLNALYRDGSEHFSFSITHSWRYYFSTSTNVEQGFWEGSTPKAQSEAEEMLKMIEDEREKIGNKIYRELSDAYFELIDDEAVRETIEANDWTFLKDGTIFNA